MRIMNERQISACECVYRLCHLNIRQSTRKCVFLNTRNPEQRYRVLKFDQNNQANGVFSNIFESYEKRPVNHEDYDFENMNLIEFVMLFEPHYARKPCDDEENIDEDAYEQPHQSRKRLITLIDNSKIAIRNKPCVLRVPFFNAQADPHNYYYSLILQYMPFRNESEILQDFNTPKDFLAKKEQLKAQCSRMEIHRKRDNQLEIAFNQVHAFELMHDPEILLEKEDCLVENDIPTDDGHFEVSCRAMNLNQREFFNVVISDIEQQLNGHQNRMKFFVTGGAGTGITLLFNLLKNQVNRALLRQKIC